MHSDLKKFSTKEYIISTTMHGHHIMPADTFEIGNNEYALLEIRASSEGILFLSLLGIKGSHLGNRYLIPKQELEDKNPQELQAALSHYQHSPLKP